MEAESGEKAGKPRRSKRLDRPTLQKIFSRSVRKICYSKDEYSLHFKLGIRDALLVVESLYADAEVRRPGNR